MKAYITYMTQRMIELHRVLKSTGSIYLHCDPTASHYLKQMMDCVFGKSNFRNEIVWCYKSRPQPKRSFAKKHDVILFYSKSADYYFNWQESVRPLSESTVAKYRLMDDEGRKYRLQGRGITDSPIQSAKDVDVKWEISHPEWVVRDYLDTKIGVILEDWWEIDIINQSSKERTGYPTQKPLALLHRIIKASSQEGDVVLDPFCGCATTCVAAQQLNRKWIGIDIEEQAVKVLIERLEKMGFLDDTLKFNVQGLDFITTSLAPVRTDLPQIAPTDKTMKEELYAEQKGRCRACDVAMRIIDFEVDHIIPRAKGGGDYYENYQLLCGSCNKIKGDRPMEYLRVKIATREKYLTRVQFGD